MDYTGQPPKTGREEMEKPLAACNTFRVPHGFHGVFGVLVGADAVGVFLRQNGAAHNGIFEFEIDIGIADGGEFDPHVTELAVTAGLLLVAALAGNLLADGFTIGDLGIVQVRLSAELGGQLGTDDIQMQCALAGNQGFGGFHILFHLDGRIFFLQTGQTGEYLIFFALLGGVNGLGNAGDGKRLPAFLPAQRAEMNGK